MNKLRFSLLCAVVMSLCVSVFGQTVCYTQPTNQSPPWEYANHFYPGFRDNPIFKPDTEFNDYGLIFEDAKKRDCSLYAKEALKTKLQQTNLYAIGRTHTHAGYTNLGPYQNWLEGANVALAAAAALAIGGNGDLTTELDTAVQEMIANYNAFPTNSNAPANYRYGLNIPGCGVGVAWRDDDTHSSDTCMDDHTVGALGHAWAAAYQHKRGNTASRDQNITRAVAAINDALALTEAYGDDSICLHDPTVTMSASGRGPCNVTSASQIASVLGSTNGSLPRGWTFSLNRGQNMVYGFGLIASISAAVVGLEEAGYTWVPSAEQKLIITALLEEAQSKSKPGLNDGEYFNGHDGLDPTNTKNCARWTSVGSTVSNPNNGGCADSNHRPRFYSLVGAADPSVAPNTFFSRFLPTVPIRTTVTDRVTGATITNAFQFNRFLFSDFKKDADCAYNTSTGACTPYDPTAKPNWARAVVYGNLAYYWHTKVSDPNPEYYPPVAGEIRPRLSATRDDYDPIGYIDGITSAGVAWGWTCDQDVPAKQIWVDFYRDNVPGLGTYLGQARATLSSESAINDWCGGGTAHRFSMQLPVSAKGHYIYPYGLDATWRGYLLLPPSSGCPGGVCIYP